MDDAIVSEPPEQPPASPPPPEPAARPRVWTLALVLVVLMLGVFGFVVVAMIATSLGALSGSGAEGVGPALDRVTAWIETIPGTLFVATVSALWFAGVALVAAQLSSRPFRDRLGLVPARLGLTAYALAILGGAALGEVVDALFLWSGLGRGEAIESMFALFRHVHGWELVAAVAVIGGFAGVAEELLFRGYFQTRLVERFGPFAGIAVTSILFGIAHVDPRHAFFAFLFGAYAGWIAWRARSIWPAIVVHVTNNAMSVLLMAAGWGEKTTTPAASALVCVASLALLALVLAGLRRVLPR